MREVSVEVAGFTFRFFTESDVGAVDQECSLPDLSSVETESDICVKLCWDRAPESSRTLHHLYATNPLRCAFSEGFGYGEIDVAISPAAFQASQLSYLELITRIVLVASGRAYPLHACGLQAGDIGLVFSGPSDAGKTTMASLWQGRLGATVFSDERVWLRRLDDGSYWVYGAPLPGPERFYRPGGARIDKMLLLRHGSRNRASRVSGVEALKSLLDQAHLRVYHQLGRELPIDFYVELVRQVPCYDLEFVPDPAIVDHILELG